MTYQEWTEHFTKHWDDGDGLCYYATAALMRSFPELEARYGMVTLRGQEDDHHWWCIAPDGTVVDPTASQFDLCGGIQNRRVLMEVGDLNAHPFAESDVTLEMYESVTVPDWPGITRY